MSECVKNSVTFRRQSPFLHSAYKVNQRDYDQKSKFIAKIYVFYNRIVKRSYRRRCILILAKVLPTHLTRETSKMTQNTFEMQRRRFLGLVQDFEQNLANKINLGTVNFISF